MNSIPFRPASLRHVFGILALSLGMALAATTPLRAQSPLARFVAPTNTTSTAVQPTFEIITSLPIDTASVHWNLAMIDTPNDFQYPTICVMLDRDTSKGDTVWPFTAVPGTGTIVNDTTIQFQPNTLGTSQSCEAVLMGLRVIDGNGDTITISDTVARLTFTTMPPPPSFVSFSAFDSNYTVRMHDTLTATFTEKLDSANSPTGPVVSLSIPSYSVIGDSLAETDSTISCTAWLDSHDSTKLHIVPNDAFGLGQMYRVAVKLSGITGDTTQDFTEGFVCQKSWRLNIVAAPTDGLTCMPSVQFWPPINDNYRMANDTTAVFDSSYIGEAFNAGDTAVYTAPAQVHGAVFKQWSGSGDPAIDTSTNPTLTITQTADQLHDINLVALYRPVTVDTICVATAGANNPTHNQDFVVVQTDTQDCSIPLIIDTCAQTTSKYYPLESGKSMTLYAYSTDDTIQFDHWSSSDSTINGNTSPMIRISNRGSVCATANFSPLGTGTTTELDVYIINEDPGDQEAMTSIAQMNSPGTEVPMPGTPWMREWKITSTYVLPQTCTIQMLDADYGIMNYYIVGPGPTGPDGRYMTGLGWYGYWNPDICTGFNNNCTYTFSSPGPCCNTEGTTVLTYTTAPKSTVIIFIQRMFKTLTVNLAMDDASTPPGNLAWKNFTPNATGWVEGSSTQSPWGLSESVPVTVPVGGGIWPNAKSYLLSFWEAPTTSVSLEASTLGDPCNAFRLWDNQKPPETQFPNPQTLSAIPSFTMTQDQQATALFHPSFWLESISFEQWLPRMNDPTAPQVDPGGGDPTGGPQWVTKSANAPDWKKQDFYMPGLWAGTGTTWTQGTPITIDLKFNKAVDPNNFKGCRLTELTTAYGQSDHHGYPFVIGQNATIDANDGRIVHLTLEDPSSLTTFTWKGQYLVLHIDDDQTDPIHDKKGEALTHCNGAGDEFYFETENPDIQWYYTKAHVDNVHNDCLPDCDGSVFTYWMSCVFQYQGKQPYKGKATAVNDGIDANTDVLADDIGFNCDGDGDGDNGSGDVDDASAGTQEDELMVDGPHCWNHIIAAGAVNREDADKYDGSAFFCGLVDDYGECGPLGSASWTCPNHGQMWFQDIGDPNWESPGALSFWGVAEALHDMTTNPTNYSKPDGYSYGATEFGTLPCTSWKEDDPNWASFGSVIVQHYTEPWANHWENGDDINAATYVPTSQRHINCIASWLASPMAPDWWGAGSSYQPKWEYDDWGGGSNLFIRVTIK